MTPSEESVVSSTLVGWAADWDALVVVTGRRGEGRWGRGKNSEPASQVSSYSR